MRSLSSRTIQQRFTHFILLFFISTTVMYSSSAMAIDPPKNVQIEDGRLTWDAVEGADEYHLYYFESPVPSVSNVGNYVRLTGGTRWTLSASNDPYGYYTVVAVITDEFSRPIEFSKMTDGVIVPYLDPNESNSPLGSIAIDVISQQCNNLVSGSICAAVCPSYSIATGGACRADAGITLHSQALVNEYQCLIQQDTFYAQADVYCLKTGNN